MGTWFDGLAKRSARSASVTTPEPSQGMTRRQVITRGAVVTGAAWTAPMLLGVRPAFAGASTCTAAAPVYSVCPDNTFKCCPTGKTCVVDVKTGTNVCDVPAGGICFNQGQGQCNGGASRCNQPKAQNPSICGGPGTVCGDGSVCSPTSPCSVGLTNSNGDDRCGGQGAPCASNADCAGKTVDQPATTCVSGFCKA